MARTIVDRERVMAYEVSGEARFVPQGENVLAYDEQVIVRGLGRTIRASQAYHYAFEASTIVVRFADGSAFYTMPIGADGRGTAVHRCSPDRYDAEFQVVDAGCWRFVWSVSGSKHLVISTSYERR